MNDKNISMGEALNDDELEAAVGGVHDEDVFRSTVRVACNSCRGNFSYIVWAHDKVIDTPCPICGARVFVDFG